MKRSTSAPRASDAAADASFSLLPDGHTRGTSHPIGGWRTIVERCPTESDLLRSRQP